MSWRVLKIQPWIERETGYVITWVIRLQLEMDGASGFDDFQFDVPPTAQRSIQQWTLPEMHDLIMEAITGDRRIQRFKELIEFRQRCEIVESFTWQQLQGAEHHVQLPGAELSL